MSEPSGTDKRPDLFDLRREHHFDTSALSLATNVSETTILLALQGKPIAKVNAKRKLKKLSSFERQEYNLQTVPTKIDIRMR